jgi:hypothetical protein
MVTMAGGRAVGMVLMIMMPLKTRAGSGSGFVIQRCGSEDPDLYQNVTDPEQRVLQNGEI